MHAVGAHACMRSGLPCMEHASKRKSSRQLLLTSAEKPEAALEEQPATLNVNRTTSEEDILPTGMVVPLGPVKSSVPRDSCRTALSSALVAQLSRRSASSVIVIVRVPAH